MVLSGMLCFLGEHGKIWRNLFISCSTPLTCSQQWNPSHEGFFTYRAITPYWYVPLPTFLMPSGSGSIVFGDLMFQRQSKSCAIVRFHTHGFENLYFHEQQDLAPPWRSLIQIHDAVVEPSFISNTGEIGQRAIKLLRRDSVREYAFRIIEP